MISAVSVLVLIFCILLATARPVVAGLLSAAVSFACLVAAETPELEASAAALEVVGVLIFPLTAITATVWYIKRKKGWRGVFRGLLWGFITLFIFVPLFLALQGIGIVLGVVFISSVITYVIIARDVLRVNVLSIIQSSIEQNLPLSAAIRMAATDGKGRQAEILLAISEWLTKGYTLGEAIKRGYRRFPTEYITTIAAAEKISQLRQAIKSIELDMLERINYKKKLKPVYPAYPIIVLLIATVICIGMLIFIIPTHAAVIQELSGGRMKLPQATLVLMNISRWCSGNHWLNILAVILVLHVIAAGGIYLYFRPRRPENPYITSRVWDFIRWHLPVNRLAERLYSRLRVIEVLRISLDAGCTVDAAIENTVNLDINQCMRVRLRRWLDMVRGGHNVSESARKCGIGRTIAWALDDKVNAGNTPRILVMLEEFHRNSYNHRAAVIKSIRWPFIILGTGIGVGYVALALYMPVITIINYIITDYFP